MLRSIIKNHSLIAQFVRRDVVVKYRGSVFGILWALITPLLMLCVYSFVFTVVFQSRFPGVGTGAEGEFALILFAGLILHGFLAECITSAPTLIINNVNLVKKVIFPLEILAPSAVTVSFIQFCISCVVLLLGCLFVYGSIPWTVIFAPIVVLPYFLLTLGLVWFLASLGVFIRDIGHAVGIVSTILLFMSTIFFPVSRLPESFHKFIYLNPVSTVVDQFRLVVLQGSLPDVKILFIYYIVGILSFVFGYLWFMRTKKAFADIV